MSLFRSIIHRVKGFFEYPGPRIREKYGKTKWLNSGQWADVQSSWVARIRYDIKDHALFVKFHKSGVICRYSKSPDIAAAMFQSSSVGRFVHQHLKGQAYTKVGS